MIEQTRFDVAYGKKSFVVESIHLNDFKFLVKSFSEGRPVIYEVIKCTRQVT